AHVARRGVMGDAGGHVVVEAVPEEPPLVGGGVRDAAVVGRAAGHLPALLVPAGTLARPVDVEAVHAAVAVVLPLDDGPVLQDHDRIHHPGGLGGDGHWAQEGCLAALAEVGEEAHVSTAARRRRWWSGG